jgi:mannose-6-phosphate isomerase-like protein (cupin superfamily)
MRKAIIKRLDETAPVDCPCGDASRVLTSADNDRLSVHVVRISRDSKAHYHTRLTETYYVLEGSGDIELDGERTAISPGTVVHIPPGVRHRAVGELVVLNIVTPPFDPADEFLD